MGAREPEKPSRISTGGPNLGIVAPEKGKGIEFADEISRLIWQGTGNWHQGDHLANATSRAGWIGSMCCSGERALSLVLVERAFGFCGCKVSPAACAP